MLEFIPTLSFYAVLALIAVWAFKGVRSDQASDAFNHGLRHAQFVYAREEHKNRRKQASYDEGYNFGARTLGRADGAMDRPIYCNVFTEDDIAYKAYDLGYQHSLEDKQVEAELAVA